MQSLTRRPTQSLCIFCALRASVASFTTASTTPREYRSRDEGRDTSRRRRDRDNEDRDGFRQRKKPPRDHGGGSAFKIHKEFKKNDLDRLDRNATSSWDFNNKGGQVVFAPRQKNNNQSQRGQPKKFGDDRIRRSLELMKKSCTTDKILKRLEMSDENMRSQFAEFADEMSQKLGGGISDDPFITKLRDAVAKTHTAIVDREITMAFYGRILMSRFTFKDLQHQSRQANLQYPSEWFPATRGRQRAIHLHVGPTNSGKTYHALKRLEQAEKGVYAGPLRLLAHEVYMRLNAGGKRCNLVTGDDRRTADDQPSAPMTSCTVEMVPLNTHMDVAVIDEIQVIGTDDRGWAWTQALLGVQADEVHLCGEERSIPIIRELVALCGEKLTIHHYERLSPLKVANRSLDGNIRNLQKGDCVVCFSVMGIHALRQLVEKTLRCSVAVIYGSLPPETRAQQARLFNDPNNDYDILIASDAVGMGLNLSIKRMVFQSSYKVGNGGVFRELQVHEVKQIAGRAGRYSTAEADIKTAAPPLQAEATAEAKAEDNADPTTITVAPIVNNTPDAVSPAPAPQKQLGLVTSLEKLDFPAINRLMNSEPMSINSAGLQPPAYLIERFVRYFPMGTPFSFLLNRLHEIATTNSRFHLCDMKQQCAIADAIEDVEELSTIDRIVFCSSPADTRRPGEGSLINNFAKIVAEGRGINILDMPNLDLDILADDFTADRAYLSKVERLHKGIVIWMWLSYRFKSIFIERDLALHVKALTEARIEETLQKLSFDFQKMRAQREQAILKLLSKEEADKKAAEKEAAESGKAAAEIEAEAESEFPEPDAETTTAMLEGATPSEDTADSEVAQPLSFNTSEDMIQDAEEASEGVPMDHVELPGAPTVEAEQTPDLGVLLGPPVLPLALGSPDPSVPVRPEVGAAS